MIPLQPRRRQSSSSSAQLEWCKYSMCHDGISDADEEKLIVVEHVK
jgi:hypothetical protein